MMIPNKLMMEHGLPTFEEWRKAVELDIYPDYKELYYMFLSKTDHIPNKIIERLIEDLASATLTDFVGVLINFIKDVRTKYKDVLEYRKLAREKINELESEV